MGVRQFRVGKPFLAFETGSPMLEAVTETELLSEKGKLFAEVSLEFISHKPFKVQALYQNLKVNWPQTYVGSIVVQVSCHSLFINCFIKT